MNSTAESTIFILVQDDRRHPDDTLVVIVF